MTHLREKEIVVNKWRQDIESCCLFSLSDSLDLRFNLSSLSSFIFTVLAITKFTLMLLVNKDRDAAIAVGAIFYPFGILGQFISLAGAFVSLQTLLMRISCFRHHKLLKKLSLNIFDTKHMTLSAYKFLHRVYTGNRWSMLILTVTACAFCLYCSHVCAASESELLQKVIWFLWWFFHPILCMVTVREAVCICSLWFAIKGIIEDDIDNMTSFVVGTDVNMKDFGLRINANTRIFRERYLTLTKNIAKFNTLSTELASTVILCSSMVNGPLFTGFIIVLKTDPIFAILIFNLWFSCMMCSICIVYVTSLMFKKSRHLSKELSRLFTSRNQHLTILSRESIKIIIENLQARDRCPLALTKLDGKVFNKITLGQYLLYSIRFICIFAKFSGNALDRRTV
jgi:hypothetical protein